jgi:hypothetical protein
MGFDYSKTAATADRMLARFGQAVTLTHVVPGTYSPGGTVTNTSSTQSGTAAIIDWAARHIDGSLIKIGDRRLLLSPLNTAGAAMTPPVLGDTVTDAAGVVYTMVSPLKIMAPAGTVALYDCNLRGA